MSSRSGVKIIQREKEYQTQKSKGHIYKKNGKTEGEVKNNVTY